MTTEEFQNAVIAINLCNFFVNLQILELAQKAEQKEEREEQNGLFRNDGRNQTEV